MRGAIQSLNLLPWLVIFILLMAACGGNGSTPTLSEIHSATATSIPPTLTPTPVPPSPTPVPLAAKVNGEQITLAEYQAEIARYEAAKEALGEEPEEGFQLRVLDDIIDQVLLAQGARQAGFLLDESTLQSRMEKIISEVGSEQEFAEWLADNGYTPEGFQKTLARSIAAAWMRDHILASAPDTAEQVHARQILLYNSKDADDVLRQLASGKDFATLVRTYDPLTLGDLGWFPRGYLTVPELEEIAFSLQPDEYSQVIESPLGFHIIQVIERDPNRSLDPDARLVFQEKILKDWLEAKRSQIKIELLLPK